MGRHAEKTVYITDRLGPGVRRAFVASQPGPDVTLVRVVDRASDADEVIHLTPRIAEADLIISFSHPFPAGPARRASWEESGGGRAGARGVSETGLEAR